MRNLILIFFLLAFHQKLIAQDNSKSLGLSISNPYTTGENFLNPTFGEKYEGIIDIGLDFNLIKLNNFNFGLSLNSSFLRNEEFKIDLHIISPRVKITYNICLNDIILIPALGIGYSNLKFKAPSFVIIDENGNEILSDPYDDNLGGILLSGGAKLVFNNGKRLKFFLNFDYEFFSLNEGDNESLNISSNRQAQILYPGIGIILALK